MIISSCTAKSPSLTISSPEVEQMLSAAEKFPRKSFGFSSLPTSPLETVEIEKYKSGSHVYYFLKFPDSSSKIIALAKNPSTGEYRWVHESETFYGNQFVSTPSGQVRENIKLMYEKEKIMAQNTHVLQIEYVGNSAHLLRSQPLKLGDV